MADVRTAPHNPQSLSPAGNVAADRDLPPPPSTAHEARLYGQLMALRSAGRSRSGRAARIERMLGIPS